MKSYRKELWFRVPSRRGLVNITGEVEKALEESGVQEGLVLVNAMNITASVFINDDEPGLHRDLEAWLEKLAPEKPYGQYRHNGYEDNADAHLKRSVMGREAVVAVTGGRLDFGTWEQIFYYEFDGRREKHVLVLLSSKIGPVLANNFPPQLLKNLFSVSEAPALIIKVQYLALMRQPVQQSCCEDSVAKKLRPAIKAFI